MILLNCVYGKYWINPRYITQMEYLEITEHMYGHHPMLRAYGKTHYTKIRTVHSGSFDVLATVEELLEVINPYLQKP